MAYSGINLVFHHGSMFHHESTTSLAKPVRLCASSHLLSATCPVTSACKPLCRRCSCKTKRLVVRCCSISEFVVSSDANYGNKQILRQLRVETASMRGSQMQVSPDQAQLLAMLVQILGAERCIEVGVYTGYSSLAIALVLPESGRLVACERDAKSLDVAKKYYQLAGVSHKVDVKLGLAADSLESLIMNGEVGSYDFAFIDAEKRMTAKYFEMLLQLVRVGGLIVIDNVLWHGKVVDPLVSDSKTNSIRNFNQRLIGDKRVSISMVPIGDGMTICRKIQNYIS
ncbi:uncharacterized protein LOC127119990 isoform X2 [Lathyrus oleraceus]|uniref:uncharacterized protein LOC127119990 isoform X2 n=1 Tax=Pisum sativum TaxID=3888 RepID=UPI0021CFA834|nr:uncharacterized protein LOC127119990 isoform X2 [Pisum sativum]